VISDELQFVADFGCFTIRGKRQTEVRRTFSEDYGQERYAKQINHDIPDHIFGVCGHAGRER